MLRLRCGCRRKRRRDQIHTIIQVLPSILHFWNVWVAAHGTSPTGLLPNTSSSSNSVPKLLVLWHSVPSIDTEVFSGDYLRWPTFRDLFPAIYIDNPSLTPVECAIHSIGVWRSRKGTSTHDSRLLNFLAHFRRLYWELVLFWFIYARQNYQRSRSHYGSSPSKTRPKFLSGSNLIPVWFSVIEVLRPSIASYLPISSTSSPKTQIEWQNFKK